MKKLVFFKWVYFAIAMWSLFVFITASSFSWFLPFILFAFLFFNSETSISNQKERERWERES